MPGSDKAHAESMGADDVMDVSSCGPTTEGNTAEVGSEHAPGSVHLNSGNDASSCGPGGSSLTGVGGSVNSGCNVSVAGVWRSCSMPQRYNPMTRPGDYKNGRGPLGKNWLASNQSNSHSR